MTNLTLVSQLRSQLPGKWQKVFEDGWLNGRKVSMHYDQHASGAVFDVELSEGWSNP
jgi:hypothetical protein